MKLVSRLLVALVLISSFTSCEFDPIKDYSFVVPDIELLSFIQMDDTVYAEVRVVDYGDEIDLIGLAYKRGEVPSFTDNQVFFRGNSGVMLLPMPFLEPEETYQIIAFATNELGLGQTEARSFTVPMNSPPEPPCNFEDNFVHLNGGRSLYSVYGSVQSDGSYEIDAYSNSMDIDLFFPKPPTNGIYTTVDNLTYNQFDKIVKIGVTYSQYNYADAGGEVYVEKLDENSYIITFCDLNYRFQSYDLEFKGKIVTN